MKAKINYPAIVTFYIIAISFRYVTNKTSVLDGIDNHYLKSLLTGIGPMIGAFIAFKIFNIKPTMSLRGNYNKLITPVAIYWLVPIIIIVLVSYFIKGTFPWLEVLTILIYGLFEEIGWRGFLYPQLKSLPKFTNIIIVTVLWFLWHMNFEVSASNLIFLGILFLGSWGIGKVADSTYSLIAVSAFHSLNNFFNELNPTKITILLLLLSIWIISLVLRKRQFEKTP